MKRYFITFLLFSVVNIAFAQVQFSKTALESIKNNNFQPALSELDAHLKLNKKDEAAFLQRATIYVGSNKLKEALLEAEAVIAINPKNSQAYFFAGSIYAALGKNDQAVNNFSKSIAIQPEFLKAIFGRANAYAKLAKNDLAITDFTTIINREPRHLESYLARGKLYIVKMNLFAARIDLLKVVDSSTPTGSEMYKDAVENLLIVKKLHEENKGNEKYSMPEGAEALLF